MRFPLVAGGSDPHRRRKKAKKKKTFPIHQFGCIHWRWCVKQRVATSPAIPEVFLCNSWFFKGYFVNFKLFNVIFV